MSDGAALLAYCHEHPDDDAARLVYADWLEEQGDEARAEFIRLQLECAKHWEGHPDRAALELREEELLRSHRERWLSALPEWVRPCVGFSRGLPTRFELKLSKLLNKGKALRRLTPIHQLVLRANGGDLTRVFKSGLLAGVRELSIRPTSRAGLLTNEDVVAMANCADLADLRSLDLCDSLLFADAWQTLARSPFLSGLREFQVSPCNTAVAFVSEPAARFRLRRFRAGSIISQNFQQLFGAPACAQLEELDLSWSLLRGVFTQALSPGALENIRRLGVSRCGLTDPDLQTLVGALRAPSSEGLNLRQNQLTAAAMIALAQSPCLKHLRYLDVSHNPVGDEGLVALARSTRIDSLSCLNLGSTDISDEGLSALAEAPWLKQLKRLDISNNLQITASGLRILCSSPDLAGLKELNCDGIHFAAEAALAIAESPHLRSLERLLLGDNEFRREGAEALARSANLTSLWELDLNHNRIGDHGAAALLASPLLDQLKRLNVEGNSIRGHNKARLKERADSRNWKV